MPRGDRGLKSGGDERGVGHWGQEGKEMLRRFHVVLEPERDGGYSVFVPALPGCASQGETEQEAMANIQEAIALYLEGLVADRQPIPADDVLWREVEVAA